MPIGSRIGPVIGDRLGLGVGTSGVGFFGQGNTNFAALIWLQSNAVGPGLGTGQEAIEAGISDDYPNVQITRYSANNIGPPPAFVAEGPEVLQPATQFVGVNFPIDHAGIELKLGRLLDARDSGLWRIIIVAINGSGVEDEWNNPAYPSGGPSVFNQLRTELRTQLTAMDAFLELIVPIGGESDAGESPDHLDFDDNLISMIGSLRAEFGPAKVVIPRLSHHSVAGGSLTTVIAGAYNVANTISDCAVVNTNPLALQVDNVHYSDAGLINLGTAVDTAYDNIRDEVTPANPRVVGIGIPSIGSSAQGTSPTMPVHQANDIILYCYSGNGNTNVGTPTGGGVTWTQVTNSPQHDGAAGGNARLHMWWTRAVDGATAAPSTADVGGDGGKLATLVAVRGCKTTGNPFVTSAGAVAAAGTAVSFPTLDTTGTANCLIMNFLAATYSATSVAQGDKVPANASLTSVEKQIDQFSTSSSAGTIIVTGVKATAGIVDATTLNIANAATQALLSVAFAPP